MIPDALTLTDLIIALVSVVVGAAGAWYARQAIAPPRLVVSANDEGYVRSGEGVTELIEVQAGETIETVDLTHYGLFIDFSPCWDDEGKNAPPLKASFFVENKGRRTAKAARIFVPRNGTGYTVVLEGGYKPEGIPAESFFRRKPEHLLCKELGDMKPGIKHPVTLVFHFGHRSELEALFRGAVSESPVLFHDYYLSADDIKCKGAAMWINLLFPTDNYDDEV